eukprot:1333801-Rhodomonas_salina.1
MARERAQKGTLFPSFLAKRLRGPAHCGHLYQRPSVSNGCCSPRDLARGKARFRCGEGYWRREEVESRAVVGYCAREVLLAGSSGVL